MAYSANLVTKKQYLILILGMYGLIVGIGVLLIIGVILFQDHKIDLRYDLTILIFFFFVATALNSFISIFYLGKEISIQDNFLIYSASLLTYIFKPLRTKVPITAIKRIYLDSRTNVGPKVSVTVDGLSIDYENGNLFTNIEEADKTQLAAVFKKVVSINPSVELDDFTKNLISGSISQANESLYKYQMETLKGNLLGLLFIILFCAILIGVVFLTNYLMGNYVH